MNEKIKLIQINYCGVWGFYPQASSLEAYLKDNLQIEEDNINLTDVGRGIFQVLVNDTVIFDNRTDDKNFPNEKEILEEITSM